MKNAKAIEQILKEVKETLKNIYGKRLKKVILYGSYARGDADGGSDIDIIILLENMTDACREIDRFSSAIGEIDLKHDTLISVIPIDEEAFNMRHHPLILNAKKEGVAI